MIFNILVGEGGVKGGGGGGERKEGHGGGVWWRAYGKSKQIPCMPSWFSFMLKGSMYMYDAYTCTCMFRRYAYRESDPL